MKNCDSYKLTQRNNLQILHKKFNSLKFKNKLKNDLRKENTDSCTKFDEQFVKVLNGHVPLKRKLLRDNHALYLKLYGKS